MAEVSRSPVPLRRPAAGQGRVLAVVLLVALAIAVLPPLLAASALIAAVVFCIAVARPALGLALLALAVPFGSLVEVRTGDLPAGPTEALAGLVVAGWLAAVLTRRADRVSLGPLIWPMLAFLGAGVLSASFAESPPTAAKELLRWAELLLVYVAATNLLRERGSLRLAVWAVLAAGASEALLGAVQFFTRIGPPSFQIGPFLRAYGTFGQPNPYAGYLGMILPLAAALGVCWRPGRRDWLWRASWLAVALLGAAVAMSLSRGAWMGLALAGVVVAVLASRRVAALVAGGAGVGTVVVVLGAFNLLPALVAQRIGSAVAYFRVFDARGVYPFPEIWAIVERMAHWQAAWEMLVDHPLVGVGPGHYVVAYPEYAILPYWKDPLGHAHNVYLNVGAEMGLIGLAAYLAMLASWLWVGLVVVRRLGRAEPGGLRRALAVGVVASLAAAAVHNVFDNLYVHGMNVHVGLLLGVLGAVGWGLADPPPGSPSPPGKGEQAMERQAPTSPAEGGGRGQGLSSPQHPAPSPEGSRCRS